MFEVLLAALIAFAVAFVATPAAATAARRVGMVDQPSGYKAHDAATPLLGGFAVAGGLLSGVVLVLPLYGTTGIAGLFAIGVGALVILIAGLLDDRLGLTPRTKFAWQVAAAGAAGICLAVLGVRLNLFLPWPQVPIIALTALWVVTITNAVNFLDNMNGLCAGLGAIAAAALAGACLGFLPYNWPRARIFLGDAGSMFIGFLLAALSVMGVYTRGAQVPVLAVFTPLFVLAIPVLDLLLVTILRLRDGHPPWVGDRRHISHRLVRRGMHPATAVAVLWAAAAACGLGAILLPTVGVHEAPLLLALLVCALGALAGVAGTRGLP